MSRDRAAYDTRKGLVYLFICKPIDERVVGYGDQTDPRTINSHYLVVNVVVNTSQLTRSIFDTSHVRIVCKSRSCQTYAFETKTPRLSMNTVLNAIIVSVVCYLSLLFFY